MAYQKWQGIGASPGTAVGRTWILQPQSETRPLAAAEKCNDAAAEALLLQRAIARTEQGLEQYEQQALREKGAELAGIFMAHRLLLHDPAFTGEALRLVQEEQYSAGSALAKVRDESVALLESLEDSYLRERAADIREVAQQLSRNLTGEVLMGANAFPESGNWIVVAAELTAAETISLPKDRIAGFLVNQGGKTSHTAILAQTYGIPAVVGLNVPWAELAAIAGARLNGETGAVEVLVADEAASDAAAAKNDGGLSAEVDPETLGPMTLAANIGSPEDLTLVKRFKGQGVGLYRTEFLFMGQTLPDEAAQVEAYARVIRECAPHLTVIRTLDIGGDKQAPALPLPQEKNPFLGVRALRLCLREPELFTTQLRAIWRASVYGPTAVMFPMIATLAELRTAKQYLEQARLETIQAGYPVGQVQVGMMIEIPAAAWIARQLAREVDFFSIGTNDLTQYTLAADRENAALAGLYQPCHPAVLGMIARVAEAATAAGIWVGICGEAAGEPVLTKFFTAVGITELSVAPGLLPQLRQRVAQCQMTAAQKQQLVAAVLECGTAEEVIAVLNQA